MPFGIINIMKPNISSCNNAAQVKQLIDNYFNNIKGEYHLEQKPLKATKTMQKLLNTRFGTGIPNRQPYRHWHWPLA
jgi:hypothetical protein